MSNDTQSRIREIFTQKLLSEGTENERILQLFFKIITESLPQYVFWKDQNSKYLGCNENFANLVGLEKPADIIGKSDADLNWEEPGGSAELFRKGDKETLDGKPITNREETLIVGGKKYVTLVSKMPIRDGENIVGLAGYFTDISELKQKENELISAKKAAESANYAKSNFITNISHDIRTPLAGIIGMAKIMLEKTSNEEDSLHPTSIIKAASTLLTLLNDVIEIAKLDYAKKPRFDTKFNIHELVNDLLMLNTPSAQEKKLKLTLSFDNNIPEYVIGDQTRIHRILLNLMSNAIKFTQKGEVILAVKLTKKQERTLTLKITVSDTGIGIPRDKQAEIFSRFFRVDPSYKSKFKGTGLGLSIVKQFVSEIDGTIDVKSEQGKGSEFSCTFEVLESTLKLPKVPAQNKEENLRVSSLEAEAATVGGKLGHKMSDSPQKKVLIVEDNEIAQLVAKHQFEKLQAHVEVAECGKEAIACCKENSYDLIVLDIGLPDIDGYEVMNELNRMQVDSSKTPVVALTAHIDDHNKEKALSCGMKAVLTKPLSDMSAIDVLNKHVYSKNNNDCWTDLNELKCIDYEESIELAGGSKENASNMLDLFIQSLEDVKKNIKLSFSTKNWQDLQFHVHKLYGGSCYCGVPRIKKISQNLNTMLREKQYSSMTEHCEILLREIDHLQSLSDEIHS